MMSPSSNPSTRPGPAVPLETLLRDGRAVRTENGLLLRSPVTGTTVLVCALTDLDGTANDEHVPEHARLATLGPARESFALLERSGVVTGVCTARSTGEARHYREALEVTGPLISENGAVVSFPDGTREVFGGPDLLATAIRRIAAALGRPIPHSMDLPGLEATWEKERRGEGPVFLGHPDVASLRRSADRCASCYLVGLSPGEKVVAAKVAAELGLTSFGELLHLIDKGADKGRALAALNAHLLDLPATQGLRPDSVAQIVFGNGENDLPLFEQALKSGGRAVLVGDATTPHGFHFDPARHPVPDGVIRLRGVSHGHAIRQSLPLLRASFAEQHGVDFPWGL